MEDNEEISHHSEADENNRREIAGSISVRDNEQDETWDEDTNGGQSKKKGRMTGEVV